MGAVTPFLGLSGSTPLSTPSYAGTPGPGPAPNPWKVNGATIFYDEGGALLPISVTGGTQGKGTINAQGVYENGQRISQGAGPPSGPAGGDLEGSFYPDPEIKPGVNLRGNPSTTTQAPGTLGDTLATCQFVADAIDALPPLNYLPLAGGTLTGPLLIADSTTVAMPIYFGEFTNPAFNLIALNGSITAPAGFVGGGASPNVYPYLPTGASWNYRWNGVDLYAWSEAGIVPAVNNTKTLGDATHRWNKVWATEGDFSGTVGAQKATAPPAGGTLGVGVMMSSTANFGLMFGTGVPDKAAPRGTVQLRGDGGGTPYYNSDGTAAGWLPIGAGGATVSLTPPASPAPGALWFYSDNIANGGTLFIYYDDGNTQQWVIAVPGPPAAVIPPGTIMDFAGVASPSGWLACIGQTVSRTGVNAALFAAIGTLYGAGDGSTTFGIPDLRGRTTAGLDPGGTASRLTTAVSGVDGATVGAAGGNQAQQTHTHSINDTHTHNMTQGGYGPTSFTGRAAFGDGVNAGAYGGVLSGATTAITANNTGAGASQNVPPVMVMNKIIKL